MELMQTAAEKTETLKTLQEQLNTVYSGTSQAIDLVNGSYEENIKKIEEATQAEIKLARAKAQGTISTLQKLQKEDYQTVAEVMPEEINRKGTFREKANWFEEYVDFLSKTNYSENNSESYNRIVEQWEFYVEKADELDNAQKVLSETTENNTKKTNENNASKYSNAKTTQKLSEATSDLVKSLDEVASAYAEQEKNGSLSYDTMLKLIDAGYAQCISLDTETGKIKLNAEAYKELARAKLAAQIAEYDTILNGTPRINSQGDYEYWKSKTTDAKLKRDALQSMYDNFDTFFESGSFSNPYSSSGSSKSSSDSIFSQASAAYKTEADKKIDLIKRELEAKKELRDETIKAIDDEIAARKRLNEDNNMEKQINEVKAQLKYGQLDEFSREQLNKKLQDLYDQKAETEWQRNAQARKDAANATYEAQQSTYNAQIDSINQSLQTVQQIMSAMADGSKSVESIINNNNTRNNTANINVVGQAFTLAQLTKAIKDSLMDDIVIR